MNFIKFSYEKLSVEEISNMVASENCGAISIFMGTTRDNFDGKTVVKLEYESYENMGIKMMEKICSDIREQWKEIKNIAIYHRLGNVPVKETSIVIAISSPHREEALKATEYCINNVKKSVPIWKKEIYADSKPSWKENKELISFPKIRKVNFEVEQELQVPYVAPHLIQIKASKHEVFNRVENFMIRKRAEIDSNNINEFCSGSKNSEFSCARTDAIVKKRKDSKSHLQVNRVLNAYQYRDQMSSDYLRKYIPSNGIEERLQNVECQLGLTTASPKNIYKRLKILEDKMLLLESISPEYIQFWDKTSLPHKSVKKKVFSLEEINELIEHAERRKL